MNTFTTITSEGMWSEVGTWFCLGLWTVILGAVGVLLFAPKPSAKSDHQLASKEDSKRKEDRFANEKREANEPIGGTP